MLIFKSLHKIISKPTMHNNKYLDEEGLSQSWEMIKYYIDYTNPDKCVKEKTTGVLIYCTNGRYYTIDGYKQTINNGLNITPLCVALVINDDITLGIALEDASDTKVKWSLNYDELSDLSYIENEDDAISDIDGEANSKTILTYYPDYTVLAISKCNNYVFANGETGYFPSLGELYLVSKNIDEINKALEACGGTKFNEDEYWTSTQYSSEYAWSIYMSYQYPRHDSKTIEFNVRSFIKI